MSIVARMYCAKTTQFAYNPGAKTVDLQVVARGEENAKWSKATPSGSVTLTINNEAAAEQFELGKEYLVTFTLAE